MSVFDIYVQAFVNYITDGKLSSKSDLSGRDVKTYYDRFETKSKVSRCWVIANWPFETDINITQAIRSEMFKKFPHVQTVIEFNNRPVRLGVASKRFQATLGAAYGQYNEYRAVYNALPEVEKMTGFSGYINGRKVTINKEALNRLEEQYKSMQYVYKQEMDGNILMQTTAVVRAIGNTRDEIDRYEEALMNIGFRLGLNIVRVKNKYPQFLGEISAGANVVTSGNFNTTLLSEENLAKLFPSKTRGLVGTGPLLLGLDWHSKLPFWIDFFNSGSAQVVMILARSGFGKTFMAFSVAIELAGIGVHWSAIDIKGGEWRKLAPIMPISEISMSGASARFVNTLRLDDIACDETDCVDFYDTAVRGTCELFEIATNIQENEANVADLRAILDTAVIKTFSTRGVIRENPETFKYTKGMTYADVLSVISSLESTRTYTDKQREICKLIKVRTSPFFMAEGRYASAFKNELSVQEILDTPGLVYDFNKNSGESLDTLDSIRVFMVQFLDGKKHSIRRKQRKHTAAFYEELQRSSNFGNLVNAISQNVTGSRSNNLTVFLLLNAVSTFDDEGFGPIKSNITTKIIGHVVDDDIKALVNNFDCKMIEDYITDISHDETGDYQNCFAIQYDTGMDVDKAMIKCMVPQELCDVFETRTKLEL